jgi:AcrR family transcriptional regulator
MARTLDPTKKEAILNAARTIILRDGYASAKMSDIAVEAGVALGTLYVYFESKEALASELGESCLTRLSSQFTQVVKKLSSPDGVDALLNWALRVGVMERDVLAMLKQNKSKTDSKPQAREYFRQQITINLQDFMARGLIRKYSDTSDLAEMVLSIVQRVILSPVHGDADPEQLKVMAVKSLQHMLFDDATLKKYWAKLAE